MRYAAVTATAVALAAVTAALLPVAANAELPHAALTSQPQRFAAGAHREGELIVAFREGVSEFDMERALRAGGATGARRSRFGPRVLAQLVPGASVAEAVPRFSAIPGVAWAEPNGLVWVDQAATFSPNDTLYPLLQWNLKQI